MFKKSDVKDIYSLSPMQEGMLFHYLMDKTSPAYFEQMSYRINGMIDPKLFERALNRIIARYDVLRTVFVYKNTNKPRQVLLKKRVLRIDTKDISHLNKHDQFNYLEKYKAADRKKGFDLSGDILLRVSLLKLSNDCYEIIWSFHHIIMDGWCTVILVKEMMQVYYHFCSGNNEPPALPPTTPYSYYIRWLEKQDKGKALEYWENCLEDYENTAVIPGMQEAKPQSYRQKSHSFYFKIEPALTGKLIRSADLYNVTLNTIFQGLWGLLLQKYNNCHDVVFGAVVSGRPPEIPGIDTMVGLFINTIPVRVSYQPGQSFARLVQHLQHLQVQSRNFEYVPLVEIQSQTPLKHNLFHHLVTFENYPVSRAVEAAGSQESKGPGLVIEGFQASAQTNYVMDIVITPAPDEINITINYDASLYGSQTIERIKIHLVQITRQITSNPGLPLENLCLLTELEKQHLLYNFNHRQEPYPGHRTIHELFMEQVRKTPDHTALVGPKLLHPEYKQTGSLRANKAMARVHLSYRALDKKSNQLAELLREKERDSHCHWIVGLMVEHSVEMIIAILGILKSGSAYLPIDPAYPGTRIHYMLNDADANILVTTKVLAGEKQLRKWEGEKVFIENLPGDTDLHVHPHLTPVSATLPAYIIYTSGSSGKPKGVLIEHRALINYVWWAAQQYIKNQQLSFPLYTSISFDLTITSVFVPLITGNRMVIYPRDSREIIIRQVINDCQVDVIKLTPTHLNILKDSTIPSTHRVKRFILGGEALGGQLAKEIYQRFGSKVEIYNEYGPTETTVGSMIHQFHPGQDTGKTVPIGIPVHNMQVYLLDTDKNPVPAGITGEIYLGGDGLAAGYLNRPGLTAEKFAGFAGTGFPFTNNRLYQTGDLARHLPDNTIEFIGRKDHQVKIRGFRIEPGEIETILLQHEQIKETVITAVQFTGQQDHDLCAFYVSGTPLSVSGLREYLARHLPGYMIPGYFVHLDNLPVTANGKIDRRELLRLNPGQDNLNVGNHYAGPITLTQEKLVEIWKDILGRDRIGIKDNFFELGGHSIKAILLVSRIHKQFNKEIPLPEIFNNPTIEELSGYITGAQEETFISITPTEKRDYYPVSPAQNRIFVLQQMALTSTVYNIPQVIQPAKALNITSIKNTLAQLHRRHESLRTSFHIIDGKAVQRIHDEIQDIPFQQIHTPGREPQEIANTINNFVRPFDLSRAPLLRMGYIELKNKTPLLLADTHHIVSDAFSLAILVEDFRRISRGEELIPLPIQYKDFSQWQDNRLETSSLKQQETWWLNQLAGELPILNLPADYPRPLVYDFAGEAVEWEIGNLETRALRKLGRSRETTLYNVMLAMFSLLLVKLSGQEEILIGTPVLGRRHEDLRRIIGMFINTVVLRNFLPGSQTVNSLLKTIHKNAVNAFENQEYPFDRLVEKTGLERDTGRNPLFDAVFSFFDTETESRDSNPYRYENKTAKFDLTLYSFVSKDRILNIFEYRTALFKKETIRRFSGYFKQIVSTVINHPGQKIGEIEIISHREKQWILFNLNNINAVFPMEQTLDELFVRQALQIPDHMALLGHIEQKNHPEPGTGPLDCALTYKELDEKSHRLSQILKKRGVESDTIVGIAAERSLATIIGILAILKARGAYLPIDPGYPQERLAYMLDDSNVKIIVANSHFPWDSFAGKNIDRVSIDNPVEFLSSPPLEKNPWINTPARGFAYIIYTSGTTGNPKGVLIRHRNVVRLLFNERFQFDFSKRDAWTLFHSFCFDFSVWEMYGALLYGGRVLVVPRGVARDPREFVRLVKTHSITVLNQTPSAFYNFIHEELKHKNNRLSLRYVIFGGEALKPGKLKKWREKYPQTILVNMYGITETTIHVTYKEIHQQDIESNTSNIGKPVPTLCAYVLDRYQQLLPTGVAGELYIGGEGTAPGYLNRPELTYKKFKFQSKHLPAGRQRQKLYKTGDLVRLNADGQMEYIGRSDFQVQVRGFRVELGEIENRLLAHEAVEDVAVTFNETGEESFLCAYVVLKNKSHRHLSEMRDYLAKKLPAFMIPHYFVPLAEIPLTINGKKDRKRLPLPGFIGGKVHTAPGNEVESKLVSIWSGVLGRDADHVAQLQESMGIGDNFFNLGGDSIKAIRLISAINKHFNADLRIVDLYLQPTVQQLAGIIAPVKTVGKSDRLKVVLEEIQRLKKDYFSRNNNHDNIDNIEGVYPMSSIEEAMVYHYLRGAGMAVYHDQTAYPVRYRDFDLQRMNRALLLLIEKHPILRSGFDSERLVKIVYKKIKPEVKMVDITHLGQPGQEAFIRGYLEESRGNPFDLYLAPLWRMRFFKIDQELIVIAWEFHHAIIDGWSNAVFLTELNNLYLQLKSNPACVPDPIKTGYDDFIAHQVLQRKKQRTDREIKNYWKTELKDYKRLVLPLPGAAGQVQSKRIDFPLGVESGKQLDGVAVKYDMELKSLCFGAYVFMLGMFSYENDFVVGLVTNTRPEVEDGDRILGCFLNTVPVRVAIPFSPGFTWRDYIQWIHEKMLHLKAYDTSSLADIMKIVGEPTREINPLFDVYFNFINFYAFDELKREGFSRDSGGQLTLENYERTNTFFDFAVRSAGGRLVVSLVYSTGLISQEVAEKCCFYFRTILNQFIHHMHETVNKAAIMPESEKRQLLIELNRTGKDYPGEKTLRQLSREQAGRIPDRTVLVGTCITHRLQDKGRFGQADVFGKTVSLTYKELDRVSGQLAGLLKENGIRGGEIIGIMMKRSVEMIVGILGILKSGGAYLPMDPQYPEERLQYMLKDSDARILLTLDPKSGIQLIYPGGEKVSPVPRSAMGSPGLAYVIYTSGSTGRPKGVMVEQGNVINFITAMTAYIPFEPWNRILALTTISFDIFVLETLVPLTVGITIVIADEMQQRDPVLLVELIKKQAITLLQVTPSRLKIIEQQEKGKWCLTGLMALIVGGEPFPVELFQRVKKILSGSKCKLYNVYGPTETTVWSTIKNLTHAKTITIGRPVANTGIYILDRQNQLLPEGAAGEISIGGHGVVRGYTNTPELSEKQFIKTTNPYNKKFLRGVQGGSFYKKSPPGGRRQKIYKTGDLARWQPGNELQFLGRIDNQVKIRGFRIELEEIERSLAGYPGVREVVVAAGADESGNSYLAAYMVTDKEPALSELRKHLGRKLPGYMIPSYFIPIEKIPLTANGKVDRKGLPGIGRARPRVSATYVEPGTPQEKEVSRLWAEVLQKEPGTIGTADNFFEIGGSSMSLMTLSGKLSRLFNREISVMKLFEHPTIGTFLDFINREGEQEDHRAKDPGQETVHEKEVLQEAVTFFEEI